jgi:hypothetical protein
MSTTSGVRASRPKGKRRVGPAADADDAFKEIAVRTSPIPI